MPNRDTLKFYTSESVSEGHPDKLADFISDSILDEFLRQEPTARVAVETLLTTGMAVWRARSRRSRRMWTCSGWCARP